jgi:HK97 family phage prohead protease
MPKPRPNESESEFLDRCTSELLDAGEFADHDEAESECSLIWARERGRAAMKIIHKTNSTAGSGLDFVLSTADVDRMGDVVEPAGIRLDNFKRTGSICLFNHNAAWPVGTWTRVRVENGALKGTLKLAPAGTTAIADDVARLIAAGILRCTSIGFRSLREEPRKDGHGIRFLESELCECSVVSIPAQPAAVIAAKALGVSDATQRLVFAESDSAQRERTKRAREVRLRSYQLLNDPAFFAHLRKRNPAEAADLERRLREFGLTPKVR